MLRCREVLSEAWEHLSPPLAWGPLLVQVFRSYSCTLRISLFNDYLSLTDWWEKDITKKAVIIIKL